MLVLVTGARGILGRQVVHHLLERGHQVRALTRSPWEDAPQPTEVVVGDLATGEGLQTAAAGVGAVIHCATDPRRHRRVDRRGTERLVEAAEAVRPHIVYPGIVGSDVIPLGYYKSKIAAEEAIAGSGMPWTIARATQFHQLVWGILAALARPPLMVVPHDTRVQPLDPGPFARRLVGMVEKGPAERAPDFGGRHAYEMRDLARSYLTATARRRPIVRMNVPGLVGAAFRAGGNLTPNRDEEGKTWNEFVAERLSG